MRTAIVAALLLAVGGCAPMKFDSALADHLVQAQVAAVAQGHSCDDFRTWSLINTELNRQALLADAYAALAADPAIADLTALAYRLVQRDAVLGRAGGQACLESADNVQRAFARVLKVMAGRER